MNSSSRSRARALLLAGVVLSVGVGCAGSVSHMEAIQSPPPREAGKARIVFMRPKSMAYAIQSSVFDVTGDQTMLAGIVAAKKKAAYDVDPGEHLFMVVGENADFMSANVEADRTYYVEVIPRMGAWKARFGIRAIHRAELDTGRPDKWLAGCKWVSMNADSDRWAAENANSIEAKRAKYLPAWNKKTESDRPRLAPEDGRTDS